MTSQRGFSLVELMVTVAIMALLLLAAMPFTRDWVDGNRQMQVRNQLWEAGAQARSGALRNPDKGVGGNALAARLDFDGSSRLQVSDNDGSVIWQATVAGSPLLKRSSATPFADAAALKASSAGFSCLAFNNRGQRVDAACNGAISTTDTRIAIGVRTQEPMYVDLL